MKRSPMRPKAPKKAPERIAGFVWPLSHWPEKKFQNEVEKLAHQLGWETSHAHLPFFDTAGQPDLFMLHPVKKRMMWRELKVTAKDGTVPTPSTKQRQWMSWIALCGGDVGVWTYPHEWADDTIVQELQR